MSNKITLGIVLFIIVLAAIFLGSTIGQANYLDLSIYGIVAFGALYLIYLYKFTWQIILLLSWSGVRFNYGFALTSVHVSMALLITYGLLIILLRRNPYPSPQLFKRAGQGRLLLPVLVLILFGIASFTFNKVAPFPGGEYSTKNMLKGYFDAFGPPLVLLLALILPFSFRIGKNVIKIILMILLVSCVINTAHMVYLYAQGYGAAQSDMDPSAQPVGAFYIPLINASLGAFSMRGVGPVAVMFSFAVLSYRGWWQSQTGLWKLVAPTLLFVGLVGSVMSGGRAAVVLCIFYIGFISLVQRKMLLIFGATGLAAAIVVFANIFSGFINDKLPMFVARPLQYVMIEKGEAMDSIEHSSSYREKLYLAGLDEWRSDPRITLMGRSVFVPMDLEEMRGHFGDQEAFIAVNVSSGTCHALLPSVLVQYGIVGALIYYLVYISIIVFFWMIYRKANREIYSQELRVVAFLMTLATTLGIIIATIGGGWFGTFEVMMILLLKSMAARDEQEYLSEQAEQAVSHEESPEKRELGQRPNFPYRPMPT